MSALPTASDHSLAFCVLASGSAGNCTAVVLGGAAPRVILLDAGLSPRATHRRLRDLGLSLSAVTDVLLTHLDTDHLHPGWAMALGRAGAPRAVLRRAHGAALCAAGLCPRRQLLLEDEGGWMSAALGEETFVSAMSLPHDDVGSTGFVIEHQGARLGLATDLGRVPPRLLELFAEIDALAIESNYDPVLQLTSPRPLMLKRRIMGGRGHLSNSQALEAVTAIARRAALQHVALLHLSRQCNCPELVRALWQEQASHLAPRLTLSSQHAPTPLLGVKVPCRIPATLWG